MGTLLAVLISTSDEAVPVISAHRANAGVILPLIATKVCLGLVVEYAFDLIYRRRNKAVREHAAAAEFGSCAHVHQVVEQARCAHRVGNGRNAKDLILNPLLHVAKISAFIFLIMFAAACGFSHVRSDELADLFLVALGSAHPHLVVFLRGGSGRTRTCPRILTRSTATRLWRGAAAGLLPSRWTS
jgi:hypothetical protein